MKKNIKGTLPAILYGVLISVLSVSCAPHANLLERTIISPVSGVPDSNKFTIAVLPFETIEPPVEEEDTRRSKSRRAPEPIDEKLRSFEKSYFPARLAQTLGNSPWIKEAYVSPVLTPSVDYLIKGGIIESNGETTTVSLTFARCCWTDIHTEVFSIDLASSHFEKIENPGDKLWIDPVNKAGQLIAKITLEERKAIEEERLWAYLDLTDKRDKVQNRYAKAGPTIQKASGWERSELLGRISRMTQGLSDRMKPTYGEWQKRSTRLWEEKRAKDLQTAISAFSAMASFGAGMASAARGGSTSAASYATAMSITSAMQSSQEAKKISEAMGQMTNILGEEVEPMSIELGGQVYTLTGTMDARIVQIKQIVRKNILTDIEH